MRREPIARSKLLSEAELRQVLDYLVKHRASPLLRANEIIFRLATCYGLRAGQIARLRLKDVRLDNGSPTLYVAPFKRAPAREINLELHASSLAALATWKAERRAAGARPIDRLLVTQVATQANLPGCGGRIAAGRPLTSTRVGHRYHSAVRCLGLERQQQLHTHCGRHTAATQLVLKGGLALARDVLGHSSIAVTNIYIHSSPEEQKGVLDSLDSPPAPPPEPPTRPNP